MKPRPATIMRAARNRKCWAIGHETARGFMVRRVVWGRVMARSEKREGETILHAVVYVAPPPVGRRK